MKFINISLFSILISIFITGCLSGGAMKSAENLVAAKDYRGAIETYQSIVDSKPNSAEARAAQLAIGRIYIEHLQKPDEGIRIYETIIVDTPESEEAAHAHYQLGMYAYNQKDYKAAQTRFDTIINKFSELELSQNAQLMLAKSYEDGQEYGQAVETFETLLKTFPKINVLYKHLYIKHEYNANPLMT